ncbi:hypothetical protein BWQ96_10708 [Gracilariopsis chorda]|uniref:Uncharacterized protein n=1 Tax=Gracilariopsis chorda TaxID=448386 RepID=A0A2V3IBX0_9FLOR|nr:hypothetical protein BWQ96_10708 [Gracilariopsis chorda]|eukprot:PXF39595.1 hypothetical protein BWQ96_10708 [Gracilariopsis chorda]
MADELRPAMRNKLQETKDALRAANLTPIPRVDARPNPVALYFTNVRRGPIGEYRRILTRFLPGWAVLALSFIGRSTAEILTHAPYQTRLITSMKLLGYAHLPDYDPSKPFRYRRNQSDQSEELTAMEQCANRWRRCANGRPPTVRAWYLEAADTLNAAMEQLVPMGRSDGNASSRDKSPGPVKTQRKERRSREVESTKSGSSDSGSESTVSGSSSGDSSSSSDAECESHANASNGGDGSDKMTDIPAVDDRQRGEEEKSNCEESRRAVNTTTAPNDGCRKRHDARQLQGVVHTAHCADTVMTEAGEAPITTRNNGKPAVVTSQKTREINLRKSNGSDNNDAAHPAVRKSDDSGNNGTTHLAMHTAATAANGKPTLN